MAAPWDGRLITYLGHGAIADRPASPNIASGIMAVWFATDTLTLSLWTGSWADYQSGVDTFIELTDAPAAYTGMAGAVLRVNADETGVEFADPLAVTPTAPGEVDPGTGAPVVYATAEQWRVLTITPGAGPAVSIGEITLIDTAGAAYGVPDSIQKSTEDGTFTAAKAFNLNGKVDGWKPSAGNEAGSWIGGTWIGGVTPRAVSLSPITGETPVAEVAIEYWDGAAWVAVAQQTLTWPVGGFKVVIYLGAAPESAPVSTGGADFTGDVTVPDDAYDASGWNGNLEVPTKNAIRDKIEDILDGVTFTGDVVVPDEAYDATAWNGSLEVPTKNAVRDVVETLVSGTAGLTQTEGISGIIGLPSNKTYRLAEKMPHAGTITGVTTKSLSGTCTATFKVGTTALGGTANAVSSSQQNQAHASSNTFVAGDVIAVTISSNASCVDMSFTIEYTRTLA